MIFFNKPTEHPQSKSGFTLLEVLIAFAILAIVMTSVAYTLIMAQRIGEAGRNRIHATQQARAALEQLHTRTYTHADLSNGTHAVSRGGLTGQYVVTEPQLNELKHIRMRFNYPSFGGTAQIELQTSFSNALR